MLRKIKSRSYLVGQTFAVKGVFQVAGAYVVPVVADQLLWGGGVVLQGKGKYDRAMRQQKGEK